MSTNNLTKFGVPVDGTAQSLLHPKQSYRFRVLLSNFGSSTTTQSTSITQNVVSVTRPSLSHEEVQIHAYNSIAYIAGKHSWETVELVIRDDISNEVAALVGQQVQKQVNHFEQVSATTGSNYKFQMEIHSLDGSTGDEIEKWVLEGCFVANVSYPQGDYSNSDSNVITLTIRYDNATNQTGAGSASGDIFPDTIDPNVVGTNDNLLF